VPVAPAYGNVKFFLQYSKDNLTALVGKIPVPTPVTATGVGEATAAGAIAFYKVNDQVTAAAAFLDDLVGTDKVTPKGNNTYALAGIFGTNMGTVQAWLFKVENIINYDAVVMANVKAVENVDLNVRMAIAKLDKAISDKTQTYFDVDAKYTAGKVCASAGFAKTGKDGGTVVLDADAPLVKVLPTEQYDNIANSADDYALYAKAGYSVDAKTNAYVAVAKADKAFNYEVVAGCNHAYTDKFKIHAYVSQADTAGKDNDNLEVSASFTYSF